MKIVTPVLVVLSTTILVLASCHSQIRTHSTSEISTMPNDLPEDVKNRMLPGWFDLSLFPEPTDTIQLSDEEWEDRLSHSEFHVQRAEGTERPFDNEYHATETEGVYVCRGCSNPLFSSVAKFSSSSGWPSYFAPLAPEYVGVKKDHRLLMERVEVHCARCGGHLGHVFEDGPAPTGLRYCMNSSSLRLIDREDHRKIAEGRENDLDFRLNR